MGQAWDRDVHTLHCVCDRSEIPRRSPPTASGSSELDGVMSWLEHTPLRGKDFEDGIALWAQDLDTRTKEQIGPTPPTGTVSSSGPHARKLDCEFCGSCTAASSRHNRIGLLSREAMNDEETEWEERWRLTGAVARLVSYCAEERPQDDFTLRGGEGRRVVAASVQEVGKAIVAGVRAGDVLVSIDGKKDFIHKTADEIFNGLRPPVQLVFMGFVGKLYSEVRLTPPSPSLGVSPHKKIHCHPLAESLELVDEIRFVDPTTPILASAQLPRTRTSSQGFEDFFAGPTRRQLKQVPTVNMNDDSSNSQHDDQMHQKDSDMVSSVSTV